MLRKRILHLSLSICLVFSLFSPSTAVAAPNELDGIVALYSFNGLDHLKDYSGQENHIINEVGDVKYEEGPYGTAAVFDGKSYFEINDSDSLDLGKQFTFSMWLYDEVIPSNDAQGIFAKLGNDWNEGFAYGFGEINMLPFVDRYDADASTYGSNGQQSDKRLEAHKWQLVTATYDGERFKFYVDGDILSQKESKGTEVITSHGKLQIGMMNIAGQNTYFRGKLCNFRIYKRVLEQQEIKGMYDKALKSQGSEKIIKPKGMVAYINFDSNTGDTSGYINHGVVFGSLKYASGIAGRAANFDGSTYIEIEDDDILDFDRGFTMNCWIKLDKSKQEIQPIIVKQESSINMNNDAFWTAVDTNNNYTSGADFKPYFGAYCFNRGDYTGGNMFDCLGQSDIKPGGWAAVTTTFDGKTAKVYVNGKLIASDNMDFEDSMVHSSGSLIIGKLLQSGETYFTKGILDELRLYNYPMDEKAIAQMLAKRDSLIVKLANGSVPNTLKVKQSLQLYTKLLQYSFRANYNTPGTGIDKFTETSISSGVVYKSLTPKITAVSGNGKVTGLAKGKATIMVTFGEQVKYVNITIN